MPDATDLRATDPAEVAGYRLVRRLGQGGQGVVYLGVGANGERVAVKQLRLEDERSRQQFVKEVAAARRVAPFCTARIIAFDLEGESPYVVSEFIEGPSLQRLVRDSGPLTGTRLERLAIGTVTALAAIHQAGVVHRDFKPANVMVSPEGPRVIDFGIARDMSHETTVTSRIFGTPAYMAPEQIRSERVSPQTDMFAWASVIAFAATGKAPFEAGHMMAVVHRITTMEPDLDGVPPALVAVLRLCLNKDADRRPSAQQALAMLLGRPAPTHDQADPTMVLAEGSRVAQASTGEPNPESEAGHTPTTRLLGPAEGPAVDAAPAWSPEHSPEYGTPETPAAGLPVPDPRRLSDPRQQSDSRRPRGLARFGSAAGSILAVLAIGGGLVGGSAIVLRTLLDRDEPTTVNEGVDPGTDDSETAAPEPTGGIPEPEESTDAPDPAPEETTEAVPETTEETGGLPDWSTGTWQGGIYQPLGQVTDYDVTLTLAAGETEGQIDIPELGCSGVLTYDSGGEDGTPVMMTTQLEDDLWDRCANASTLRLTRTGQGELLFSWQDDTEASNTSAGTLQLQ